LAAASLVCTASAQVCQISAAGLNRERRVAGPIHAECPPTIHTVPFGNWGVTSNFGQKGDTDQFQGWCRQLRVCDNDGNCSTQCSDDHYEWNSCTDVARWASPNCTLYNDANCTRQVSTTGVNVHGTRVGEVRVRCPTDTNQDGIADQGGCADARVYRSGTNFMSLYEIDPGTSDELIQTMYFPEVVLDLQCDQWGCTAPVASVWMRPTRYDSPETPAKVTAEMQVLINSAIFIDTSRACRGVAPAVSAVSAASFRGPAGAPESILTLFGRGLATGTASAPVQPLPTVLAGTQVTLTDASGGSRPLQIFYMSPGQANVYIPAGLPAGTARLNIQRTDSTTAQGTLTIAPVAPGVFTANSNGSGVAAATAVRVTAAGASANVPVFQCPAAGSCTPVPIDLGGSGDQVYLSLYATGVRAAQGSVTATIGGLQAPVLYAGAQNQFLGLDQINLAVPAALRGRGTVDVVVTASGIASNVVQIAVQ
jgi:uncharacterized protein (TIGR03437 family)